MATARQYGSAITVNVLANDSDLNTDPLVVTHVTQGTLGTVAIINNGALLSYTPSGIGSGVDTFSYTISDGHGGTASATVAVTILSNVLPQANNDTAHVLPDTTMTLYVLANDTDADGDQLTITDVTQATNGSVTITNGGAAVSFQPNTGFLGTDTFAYSISDGHGGSATANVTLKVQPNSSPTVNNDNVVVRVNSMGHFVNVMSNDTDLDGDPLTVSAVTQGTHGDVIVINNGSAVSYRPWVGWSGSDTFTYTISDGNGGTASATVSVAIPISVAVVIGMDDISGFSAIMSQLNNDTYFNFNATLVSSSQVDTITELNAFDVAVIGNSGSPNGDGFDNGTFTAALRNWVESGHGVVATGWTVYGAGPNSNGPIIANIDAIVPVATSASHGSFDGGSTLVPNATAHPVTVGVTTFGMSGNDFVEFSQGGIDGGATVLATTNGYPTVVVGRPVNGRSVYLGPIYSGGINYFNNAELRSGQPDRLLEQAVAWAASINTAPTQLTMWPRPGSMGPLLPSTSWLTTVIWTQIHSWSRM